MATNPYFFLTSFILEFFFFFFKSGFADKAEERWHSYVGAGRKGSAALSLDNGCPPTLNRPAKSSQNSCTDVSTEARSQGWVQLSGRALA